MVQFPPNFVFYIVNFPFLDGDVPWRTSYGVYISHLIRFVRASSNFNDFNYRNKALTAKLLRQAIVILKTSQGVFEILSQTQWLVRKI